MMLLRQIERWFACVVAALIAMAAMVPHGAQAQMPKTIRILVPFPAGGPSDVTARLLAEQIGKLHNVALVVENRPGGADFSANLRQQHEEIA